MRIQCILVSFTTLILLHSLIKLEGKLHKVKQVIKLLKLMGKVLITQAIFQVTVTKKMIA
jgi:chromate transport protein ChrA